MRPSRKCGPQLVKVGKGRWSAKAEATFLAHLCVTGCVRRAARGAGFSTTTLYNRRESDPGFADRWDAAGEHAKAHLRSLVLGAGIATFGPDVAEEDSSAGSGQPLPKVTVAEAIAILRLGGIGKGGKPSRYAPPEPSIEEVRDEVLRRLAAMRRHRGG